MKIDISELTDQEEDDDEEDKAILEAIKNMDLSEVIERAYNSIGYITIGLNGKVVRQYKNGNIKLVLLLVYLVNLSLFILLVAGCFNQEYLKWGLLLLLIKTIFEYPFMIRIARFFQKQNLLPWFIVAQPFLILYIVLSASLSFFKSYEWKGRKTVGV